MASNVLTAKILVEAPGVQNTFNQVAAATNKAGQNLKNFTTSSGSATQSLVNLSRVAQDAPYGFIGIANNINPLLESFQRLKAETGTTKGAFAALKSELTGAGGLGLAIGVISSLLVVFGDSIFGTSKKMQEAKNEAEAYADAIKGIYTETAKEVTQVATLVTVLRSETETRERKLSAIKKLQSINPEVFNGLKLEGEAVAGLDAAYTAYLKNLTTVITLKIKQQQLESLITKQLQLQGEVLTQGQKEFVNLLKQGSEERKKAAALGDAGNRETLGDNLINKRKKQIADLQVEIDNLLKTIGDLGAGIKLDTIKPDTLKVKPDKIELGVDRSSIASNFNFEFGKLLSSFKFKIKPKFDITGGSGAETLVGDLSDEEKAFLKAGEDLSSAFNSALNQGIAGSIESLGEGLGNLLSGKDFGKGLFTAIGDMIVKLGKALIEFGIVKKFVENLLKNPFFKSAGAVIGVGIAAIAIGTAIKNLSGARAAGGPVSAGGTYLVGEKGPELFTPNTGGNIVPNHALNGTGSSMAGGMTVKILGEFVQRGQDLIAAITLANQSKARLI